MEPFFVRFKNALVLIAVLLAETLALATQVRRPADPLHPDGPNVRLLRLWTAAALTPFERLSHGTGLGLHGAWTNYIALRGVREQNQALTAELARMRLERAALADDALSAQRLRTLLRFQQQYLGKTVAAQVIGTSGSDGSRVLTLDKGSHDGLRPDMAVITPDGAVGKLRDVFPGTAQLLLLNDTSSGAGVLLATTRMRAVVHGTLAGGLLIGNLTADERIQPGERVVTSGGDRVFPRGLPVGVVASVAADPDHQPYTSIALTPAVNLNRLDEVLVVLAPAPAPDAQTTAELVADAATHAADISAARLPSLHEPTPDAAAATPGSTPPAPGQPNPGQSNPGQGGPTPTTPAPPASALAPPPAENAPGLVPKPRPALHPDHYSPGSAPPADQLTPGAPAAPLPHPPASKPEQP